MILTSDIGYQSIADSKEDKLYELKKIAITIFNDKILRFSEFTRIYCESTGKSIPTAKSVHANLKKLELIKENMDGYSLSDMLISQLQFDNAD